MTRVIHSMTAVLSDTTRVIKSMTAVLSETTRVSIFGTDVSAPTGTENSGTYL